MGRAAPASRDFCVAAAERGHNIGGLVNALGRLLDRYGAAELDVALRSTAARPTRTPYAWCSSQQASTTS